MHAIQGIPIIKFAESRISVKTEIRLFVNG